MAVSRTQGAFLRLLFLLLAATCSLPSLAQRQRPRVFLIVCDGLSWDDLHLKDSHFPHLTSMAKQGAIGLMNCATGGPKNETSALLALAVGQLAPSIPSDENAANDWEKIPGKKIGVREFYMQQMGLMTGKDHRFDPHRSIKHLGILELQKRGLADNRLGALFAQASPPVTTWTVGNADTDHWNRRIALLTADAQGVASGMVALRSYDPKRPFGLADDPRSLLGYALWTDADFVVLQLGDGARAEAGRALLTLPEYQKAHLAAVQELDTLLGLLTDKMKAVHPAPDILLISPRPPASDRLHPDDWNRLPPILAIGPDFPEGHLTSPTTRTNGIVSNTDLAPTLLALYHLPVPPSMTGRPMRVLRSRSRLSQISRQEAMTARNASALVPAVFSVGIFCFACCGLGILAVRFDFVRLALLCGYGLLYALQFPSALLFAPLASPQSTADYLSWIGGGMAALLFLSWGLSKLMRISLPVAGCLLNLVIILSDVLSGQHLLREAVISNYALPGFRYYGIGNDYLGIVVACALVGGFSLLDDRPKTVPILLVLWLFLSVALCWTDWGANAGSLIVTFAGFGVGWRIARGKRHLWLTGGLFALIGWAGTFGFALLDARLHRENSAHAGNVLRSAEAGRGVGYLVQIALRKLQFNLSLLLGPWIWVAGCSIAIIIMLGFTFCEKEIQAMRLQRPWFWNSLPACGAAMLASLLFKDSGFVTAEYLMGCTLVLGGAYLFLGYAHARAEAI